MEVTRLLLDRGADPRAHGWGSWALYFASGKGDVEVARMLLSFIYSLE